MIPLLRSRSLALLALTLLDAAPAAARTELYRSDDLRLDVSARRGLRLQIFGKENELRLGGRFHLDAVIADEDERAIDDDIEVRRARLYLAGRFQEDWSFKAEYELANGRESWRNLWLRYKLTRRTSVRVGNFVAPFGLEEVASSNYSTFLERGLPSVLAPAFQTGVQLRTRGRVLDQARWTFSTAGYLEPLGDAGEDRRQSEHWGIAARGTFAPIAERRRLLHLGGSLEYRNIRGSSRYSISARPESGIVSPLLNTGRLAGVDDAITFGIEAAGLVGPFSLQGEYLRTALSRDSRPDPAFDGWTLQASWVATGESRRYSRSSGSFRGVKPKRDWGAVELALRISDLDLNDETVTGGEATQLSAGITWYLRQNARLMFNLVDVVDGENSALQSDEPTLFLVRFAVFL